ncbi:CRISPR system cascade subunit CasD [mine drainage metagenome]|uniref:CRISPR system cascade subunit CasD n=1 Tax=mine drainage metagenome TaxID=410659 RepID=A0A1J5R2I6_9ZZZZ
MAEREFLIFRLMGPMMAFGDIAVGEWRGLWDAPSKSGVLGLVAAALGVSRQDDAAHAGLEADLGFAVRVDHMGTPLRDYHTAQAPTEAARTRRKKGGLPTETRKADLECDDLNTVLSERFYRLEAAVTVALWVKPGRSRDLAVLKEALRRPRFTLYLGRKSCPLGAPPQPLLIFAEGLLSALGRYDACLREGDLYLRKVRRLPRPDASMPVWFEWNAGLEYEESLPGHPVRLRRDRVRNRALWHFAERQEGCLVWSALEEVSA